MPRTCQTEDKRNKNRTGLAEDMNNLNDTYPNERHSDHQKEIWRNKGRNRAITQDMLGTVAEGGHEPLRLLLEDGFDGLTVGSKSVSDARKFLSKGADHIFPPTCDLARFGVFHWLPVEGIVLLCLKNLWERHLVHDVMGWRPNGACAEIGGKVIADTQYKWNCVTDDKSILENAFATFPSKLKTERLFREINDAVDKTKAAKHSPLTTAGYTRDSFKELVTEMILERVVLYGLDTPEVTRFFARREAERRARTEGSAEQQEEYWLTKLEYQQLRRDVAMILFEYNNLMMRCAETERRWRMHFGGSEILLEELAQECALLIQIYEAKQNDPCLTREQAEETAGVKLAKEALQAEKKIAEMKNRLLEAYLCERPEMSGMPASPEDIEKVKEAVRKEAFAIAWLTQPDRLQHFPGYVNLSEAQQARLDHLLRQALAVKNEALGFGRGYLFGEIRSLDDLQRAKREVITILRGAGIDIPEHADAGTPKGETLSERLAWLKQEIDLLDSDLVYVREKLNMLTKDSNAAAKEAILNNAAKRKEMENDFNKKVEELRTKVSGAKAAVERLFPTE